MNRQLDPPDAERRGSGLAAERARRQARVDELRAQGREPYPYRFQRTHSIAEVRAAWTSVEPGTETTDEVTVAGRILLKRDTGKLVFLTIADRGVDLQLFVSRAVIGDDGFAEVKTLDLGDWVGAHGLVMATRAGELSVKVDRLDLLAKAIRPLPDKWHGLADPDTRFRQRYVDLVVNAEARRVFEVRHAVIASFRTTMQAQGFTEVETPVLHAEPGGAHARPFATHHNTLDLPMYLRIALELHLKRLIVGGMDRVFEIGRVFRNEGLSPRHNTEFTMFESYEAFADAADVMELTEDLIRTAAADALGRTTVEIRGQTVDLADPWPRHRMVDLVGATIGQEVHPAQPIDQLRRLAADHGVTVEAEWGPGRLVEELFGAVVEPGIVGPCSSPDTRSRSPRWPGSTRTTRCSPIASSCSSTPGRSPTATASSTTPSSSACGSPRRSGHGPRATSSAARSTRTTCGHWSTGCRRRAGSASAWTAWSCCWPGSTRSAT